MTWKTDCGTCRHACSQTVHIGDTAYGNDVEDWSCAMEDKMNDEDVELSNQGKCPLWSPDIEDLKDRMAGCMVMDYDCEEILEAVCTHLGIDMVEIRKEAVRRKRIKKVGDMYRDPDYHDIMVEMVQSEWEEW